MGSYETIFEDIGGFGWWQFAILILISTADIFGSTALFLPVFTGATPNFECDSAVGGDLIGNVSTTLFNASTADTNNAICLSCKDFRFDDDFDSIISEWNLVCGMDYVSELIVTIQMLGLLLGATIFSQLSDMYGRKKAYIAAVILMIASGVISGFSPSWQTYAAMRFLVGMGTGGYLPIGFVYPLEFIGAKWRTLCGTVGLWAAGELMLTLVAYYERRWRYLTVITSLLGIGSIVLLWLVPESPRWLANKGRYEEAKEVFATIAKRNKRIVPPMEYLDGVFQEEDKYNKATAKYTYLDLFKSRKVAIRTVIVCIIWFTIIMGYYVSAYFVKYLSGNRYLNMLYSGLVDQTAMLIVIPMINILGRKKFQWSMLATAFIANVGLIIFWLADIETEHATMYKGFALLGKAATVMGTYGIQIHAAELFPTCMRNLACGAGSGAARIGGFSAPLLLYLGTKFKIIPFVVIASLCVVTFPLICVLPETNMRPLEDSASPSAFNAKECEARDKMTRSTTL